MVTSYTAKYTKMNSGYMGQLVEWPEVITEGKDIDECREMLRDALGEMILVYKQQTAGTGDEECNRHLRARTDDTFANRTQLPRYDGACDHSAVRPA